MLIDSSDVTLRPVAKGDVDEEFCRWYRNEDGHLSYFSGSGRVFGRDSLLTDISEGLNSKRWFYYLVTARDGVRIGTVKVGPIDQRNLTSDLVSLIGNRAYVGRGLGAQAVAAASRIAFTQLGIRRLHSGMYAQNVLSIRAYVRAGWFIEATMRGFYLVDGAPMDRVCVACLNPAKFPDGGETG